MLDSQQQVFFFYSFKRKQGKKKEAPVEKHYSTWSDKYANIDRFFLWASPFLFLVFNIIYWFYFYVYDLLKMRFYDNDDDDQMRQRIIVNEFDSPY